jgi:hypothetical protein
MRGGRRQLLEVVGDEDGRDAGVDAVEQVDRLEELLARGDVEAGRWLVEQQEPRIADEGAGDEGPAALSVGQGGPSLACFPGQAQGVGQAVGPGDLAGLRLPSQRDLDGPGDAGEDDLADGQRRSRRVARVDVADGAAERAPFGPRTAQCSPGCTAKVMPCRISLLPRRKVTSRRSTTGPGPAAAAVTRALARGRSGGSG